MSNTLNISSLHTCYNPYEFVLKEDEILKDFEGMVERAFELAQQGPQDPTVWDNTRAVAQAVLENYGSSVVEKLYDPNKAIIEAVKTTPQEVLDFLLEKDLAYDAVKMAKDSFSVIQLTVNTVNSAKTLNQIMDNLQEYSEADGSQKDELLRKHRTLVKQASGNIFGALEGATSFIPILGNLMEPIFKISDAIVNGYANIYFSVYNEKNLAILALTGDHNMTIDLLGGYKENIENRDAEAQKYKEAVDWVESLQILKSKDSDNCGHCKKLNEVIVQGNEIYQKNKEATEEFNRAYEAALYGIAKDEADKLIASGQGKLWDMFVKGDLSIEQLKKAAEEANKTPPVYRDPLVVDLAGNGFGTKAVADGTHFDMDNNGTNEKTGWIDSSDAFLAMDRNGDGKITNSGELFGDRTALSNGKIATSGVEALADLDENKDGKINSTDSAFQSLRLWQDIDGDGITDDGELRGLADFDIAEIRLNKKTVNTVDSTEQDSSKHSMGIINSVSMGNLYCVRAMFAALGRQLTKQENTPKNKVRKGLANMNKAAKPSKKPEKKPNTAPKGLAELLALWIAVAVLTACGDRPPSVIRPLPPQSTESSSDTGGTSQGGDTQSNPNSGTTTPEDGSGSSGQSQSQSKAPPPPSGIDWGKTQEFANPADVGPMFDMVTANGKPLKFPFTVAQLGEEYTADFDKNKMAANIQGEMERYDQYGGGIYIGREFIASIFTKNYEAGKERDAQIIAILDNKKFPVHVNGIGADNTAEEMYAALGAPAKIGDWASDEVSIYYKNENQTISFIAKQEEGQWILEGPHVTFANLKLEEQN